MPSILAIRFQFVPDAVKATVFAVNDLDSLNALLKKAMVVVVIDGLLNNLSSG